MTPRTAPSDRDSDMDRARRAEAERAALTLAALERGENFDGLRPCIGPAAWHRALALCRLGRPGRLAAMLRGSDRIPDEVTEGIARLVQSAKPAPDPGAKPGRPRADSHRHSIRQSFDGCDLRELAESLRLGRVTHDERERAAKVIENRRRQRGQPPIEVAGLLVRPAEVKKLLIAADSKTSAEVADKVEAAGLMVRKSRVTRPSTRAAERLRTRAGAGAATHPTKKRVFPGL